MEKSSLKLALFANDLDYMDESASCKEDGPAQQLFFANDPNCVDGPASCKEHFRYYNLFFLAHRTKLVDCVRTAEEG